MTTDLLGTYREDGSDSNVTESQRSRIGRNAVSLGAIVHHVHSTNCPIKLTNLTLEASATTFPENQSEGKLSCPVCDIAQIMSAAWFPFPFTSPRKAPACDATRFRDGNPAHWRHLETEMNARLIARNSFDSTVYSKHFCICSIITV